MKTRHMLLFILLLALAFSSMALAKDPSEIELYDKDDLWNVQIFVPTVQNYDWQDEAPGCGVDDSTAPAYLNSLPIECRSQSFTIFKFHEENGDPGGTHNSRKGINLGKVFWEDDYINSAGCRRIAPYDEGTILTNDGFVVPIIHNWRQLEELYEFGCVRINCPVDTDFDNGEDCGTRLEVDEDDDDGESGKDRDREDDDDD